MIEQQRRPHWPVVAGAAAIAAALGFGAAHLLAAKKSSGRGTGPGAGRAGRRRRRPP